MCANFANHASFTILRLGILMSLPATFFVICKSTKCAMDHFFTIFERVPARMALFYVFVLAGVDRVPQIENGILVSEVMGDAVKHDFTAFLAEKVVELLADDFWIKSLMQRR